MIYCHSLEFLASFPRKRESRESIKQLRLFFYTLELEKDVIGFPFSNYLSQGEVGYSLIFRKNGEHMDLATKISKIISIPGYVVNLDILQRLM